MLPIDVYKRQPEGIDGFTLAMDMEKQAERFQIEHKTEEVSSVQLDQKIKEVVVSNGTVYSAKSVIIASGASARELGLPAEDVYQRQGENNSV